jgi:hypothetical protein
VILSPHGFETGFSIRLKNTNSVPNMDGYYRDIQVIDTDTFTISNPLNVLSPEILPLTVSVGGYNGILLSDLKFLFIQCGSIWWFFSRRIEE